MISASPKVGKTTFLVHQIMHMRGLVPPLGDFEAVDGARDFPIGYFNEMGEINLRKAVREVKPGITDKEMGELLDTIIIYDRCPTLDHEGLQQLEASIIKHNFRMFVIDTIAALCPSTHDQARRPRWATRFLQTTSHQGTAGNKTD